MRLGVLGLVADQAAGDLAAGLVADHHRVALVEAALDAPHARRPAGSCRAAPPPPRRRPPPAPRPAPGSRRSRPCRPRPGVVEASITVARSPSSTACSGDGAAAQRDHRGAAGGAGDPGGGELGGHAAGADPGAGVGPAGHGLDLRRQPRHAGQMLGGRIAPRDRRCRARPRPTAAPARPRRSSAPRGRPAGRCRRSGSPRSPPCRSR